MSEELAKKFWIDIASMHDETSGGLRPVRVTVVSDVDGEVTLIRADDDTQEPEGTTHPKATPFVLPADVDAYALPLGNDQLLLLGQLRNDQFSGEYVLDAALKVNGNMNAEGGNVYGDAVVATNLVTGDGAIFNTTVQALTGFNGPIIDGILANSGSQASADTPSTTNTSTLQDAISVNLVLPLGTYTVWVQGGVNLVNSASATARVAATIDGNTGNIHVTPALTTSSYTYCVAAHDVSGISGSRTIAIKIQYRCGSANTTTASNPSLMVIARRTA